SHPQPLCEITGSSTDQRKKAASRQSDRLGPKLAFDAHAGARSPRGSHPASDRCTACRPSATRTSATHAAHTPTPTPAVPEIALSPLDLRREEQSSMQARKASPSNKPIA